MLQDIICDKFWPKNKNDMSVSETLFELIPMLPLISRDTFWKFIIAPETIALSETTYSNSMADSELINSSRYNYYN